MHQEKSAPFRFRFAFNKLGTTKNSEPMTSNAKLTRNKDRPIHPTRDAILDTFETCKKYCQEYKDTNRQSDDKLHQALVETYRLVHLSRTNKDCQAAYNRLLQKGGVSITGNTTNEFISAVKIVFKEPSKSSTGRYSHALYAADAAGVKPQDLSQFFTDNGNLVKVASKGSGLLNPDKASKALERDNKKLLSYNKNSKSIKDEALSQQLVEGISTGLFQKGPTGEVRLLSARQEKPSIVHRYKPLK